MSIADILTISKVGKARDEPTKPIMVVKYTGFLEYEYQPFVFKPSSMPAEFFTPNLCEIILAKVNPRIKRIIPIERRIELSVLRSKSKYIIAKYGSEKN